MSSRAIVALALTAFAVGTSELVIAGLLPTLATDLEVDIPTAGGLITTYALGVAIGGPILALLTTSVQRKRLILILVGVFIVGQVLCAIAPNYWSLLIGRLVSSSSHGLFFGVANVIAINLVAENRRGSAIAAIAGGVTIANLLGAPLGTAIGNAIGWRLVFVIIAALSVAAVVTMAVLLPRQENDAKPSRIVDDLAPLGRQGVYMSFVMIAAAVAGYFVLFSYLAPLLINVTKVSLSHVPIVLFVAGVGGAIGTFLGGRLGDWKPMPSLVASFALTAICYVLITVALHDAVFLSVVLFALTIIAWAFVAPVQTRIFKWASDAPNFISTLTGTAFNVGIAAGAFLGGLALTQGWGYERLPWISAACVLIALFAALVSWSIELRTRTIAAGICPTHGSGVKRR